ncbi:Golgi-body localization domain-containing protein [Chloropicon primus]|uniref:Golgi-body localization domain-containing protein n=1 Tax=Chloropicon primus TaxID=1764295 RepID=A0A5B8MEZ9_9CHLO|nr:Golgi-body localization domain-containing protein [Chloropicon primus]|mmetsp:Transcript_13994/g.39524  ORF Transcript_13994/g.39524 Transcript_13994/m.39524 type:complete len:2186 (-) Transcript_13994:980-7537(-)|eukprot:QDZ17850.1 Golgi-body localization domain-containing protein [Chloropicon primus]
MWVPSSGAQWAWVCVAYVVVVLCLKRLGAKLLAGLLTRDNLVVNIKVVSLAKLKSVDLKIRTKAFNVRVLASEVAVDRVRLIQAVSEVFVWVFRGFSFNIPIRVSGLVVTLDKIDAVPDDAASVVGGRTKGKQHVLYQYFKLYLSRVAVFVLCLFRVDVDSFRVNLSRGDVKIEFNMENTCMKSQKRSPSLSMKSFSARASLHLKDSGAADLVLCESQLEDLSVKASGLEILDSGLKYHRVDVDMKEALAAHTSQLELLVPLVETSSGPGQNEMSTQASTLMAYAPKRVNVTVSNIRVHTLEDKTSHPWYGFEVSTLSIALTHRTRHDQSFPSFKAFRYTWQLQVKSDQFEGRLVHNGHEIAEVLSKDIKSVTTSTKTKKLVQNVIVNVESIKTRVKPVREDTIAFITTRVQEYQLGRAQVARAKGGDAIPRTDDLLGLQIAINNVSSYFDSQGKESLVTSLPNLSVNLQKKPEGFFSHIDCRDLGVSLSKEGKRFTNSKLSAIRNQDIVVLGNLRMSSELTQGDSGSPVFDLDANIVGCEVQLASQYLLVADIINQHGSPIIAGGALKVNEGVKDPKSSVIANVRVECSKIALHFSPVGGEENEVELFETKSTEQGLLCRVDFFSFSSMQGETSNLHVKKLTLCKSANFESLDDSSGVFLYLTTIEDLTLTISRVVRGSGDFQHVLKVWCSRLKVESDCESSMFLLQLSERASKDFDRMRRLPLVVQLPRESREPVKPLFDIQTHRLDVVFKESRKDIRVSVRSLVVRDEKHFESKYVSLFVLDKEVLKLKGVRLGVKPTAEDTLQITLRINLASGRLPDKLEVGEVFNGHISSFSVLEKEIKKRAGVHLGGNVEIDPKVERNYNLIVNLNEWEIEVEHSQFETWLSSHKSLLYECNLGMHLVKETSQGDISVFDYFSPSKNEERLSDEPSQNRSNEYLCKKLIRSYVKACGQIGSKRKFFKNALSLSGKGTMLRLHACQSEDASVSSMGEIARRGMVLKKGDTCLMDLSATFTEIFAHVTSMPDPFAHVRMLQISSSPPPKPKSKTSMGTIGTPESNCSIYGDIHIGIERLEGKYGVAMEPYFAYAGRALRRLSPSGDCSEKKEKGHVFEHLHDTLYEHFHLSVASVNAVLLAETDLPEDMTNADRYNVAFDDFELGLAQSTCTVACKNFVVDSAYKIHRGNALSSSVQYEYIPILKSPAFGFSITLDLKDDRGAMDEAPTGMIFVSINFMKGVSTTSPVVFAGERQVKCLAHIICLLKDPPDALRDSFQRKPYGCTEETEAHKFVKKLKGLEFEVTSDPLQIRFWDPLPNAEDHVATLDVQDYLLAMSFVYTDLRMKVANAKVRRVPKLKEIDIRGNDLIFNLKESADGGEERTSETSGLVEKELEDKIAKLLGNAKHLDSFKDKESLVLRIESMTVSQRRKEGNLLERAPFKIEIHKPRGLINTFKRDALYTCIQAVASGINDVLNEHEGEDERMEEACVVPKRVTLPEKEVDGKSTTGAEEQDLLSLLLEKDEKQIISSSNAGTADDGKMDLNFVIEAIQPQFNMESEGANGRFLLSAEKAIVKGYKGFVDGVCFQQKSEIALQSIQMHICQLDVDPNAKVQWLDAGQVKSGTLVSANESLLHSVFDPCSISLNLFQRGQYFEIDIDLASLTLALDSREFQITSDVVSRIALSPFPKMSEKVSLSLLGSDMLQITKLGMFASPEQLDSFQSLNRAAYEDLQNIVYAQQISKRAVEEVIEKPGIRCPDASYLKERLGENMRYTLQEKKDLVKTLLQAEKKAKALSSTNHKHTKVSLKVNEVKWSLCKDRKVFMEATLKKVNFSRVRYEDFSGITRFQIGDVTCVASILDEKENVNTYEVLRNWQIKEYDSVPFIHIYMVANGESNGLSSFELCDITMHPIEISMAQKTASEIQKYFFHKTLSPEERQKLWSHVSSSSPAPPRKSANLAEKPGKDESGEQSPGSSSRSHHKSTRSLDLSARSMESALSSQSQEVSHVRAKSFAMSATDYLLEDEDMDENLSMLDLLNGGFPLSPSDRKLIRQDSMKQERGILLNKVRFNELGIKVSFESIVLNVSDMKVYLDTFNYLYYKGTWKDLLDKVKWNIVKSVVKNVAGFQFGKIKAFTSSLTPSKLKPISAKKKSIFSWNRGESPPGSSEKKGEKDKSEDAMQKRKLLFGDKYVKK